MKEHEAAILLQSSPTAARSCDLVWAHRIASASSLRPSLIAFIGNIHSYSFLGFTGSWMCTGDVKYTAKCKSRVRVGWRVLPSTSRHFNLLPTCRTRVEAASRQPPLCCPSRDAALHSVSGKRSPAGQEKSLFFFLNTKHVKYAFILHMSGYLHIN